MSLLKRVAFLVFAAFLHAPVVTTATAATFDIHDDFSIAANPNGVWSYGFSATLGGPLVLYDQSGTSGGGLQFWRHSVVQSLGVPANFNNPTASPIGLIPAQTSAFHPGSANQYSIYRFTTPAGGGNFDLDALFTLADSGGTDVHILRNNVSIFSPPSFNNQGDSASFSTTLALVAGELVDFAVGFGTDGSFFFDTTLIDASLATIAVVPPPTGGVPEPGTLLLVCAGVLGLVGLHRRRKLIL